MATFDYKGFDSTGRKVSGTCEGSGQRAVIASLRQKGIFASDVSKAGRKKNFNPLQRLQVSQVPIEQLAIATRQLSTLLGAGLSLEAALDTVAGQVETAQLTKALTEVREAVIQGEALHQALADAGRIFPAIYLNMAEVGENSGTLDQALANLADLLEEQARLRSRIISAMAYPLLMALVGCGVLLFLVTYVLPKVTTMLLELEQVLPLPTRMLIAASNLLQSYGWLLALFMIAALLLARSWSNSETGRQKIDRWRLKLPLSGKLHLLIATSRFSRTLATLVGGGLPLLRALEVSSKLLNNRVLQQAVEDAGRQVREGSSLAEPLRKTDLFPAMLTQMIAVGEKSGELEQMLGRVADSSDQQIEIALNRLLALLEPVMILLMGSAVGFIVLAILLPIFQASQSLG